MIVLFIHLGTKPPRILFDNLGWFRKVHPEVEVQIATDLEVDHFPGVDSSLITILPPEGIWHQIKSSPYSTTFRDGYWLHTIRRLGAFVDAHRIIGKTPVLHIESDMLLLPEFPWKAFVGLDKLAWLRWKNHGDMPGFLFSPAPSNSDLLGSLLLNELGKDADLIDTTALREVAKMLGPEVTYLPIGPEITKYNERFGNWIFDPLAYGAYLFGVDPRNHWGLLRRQVLYPNDSVVDPTFAKFNLSGKALSVVFPASSTPFRLASLHVHAKNRFLFKSSFHRLALGFAVMLANKKCLRVAFRPAAFFEALCETLKAAKRKLRTGKKN